MLRRVACIVEGQGDELAAPVLLRAIAHSRGVYDVEVLRPHRVPRNRMLDPDRVVGVDLARAMLLQASRVGPEGLVVILLDADDDDPADLITSVEDHHFRVDCARLVVPATREYEAWFLAGLASLRSHSAVRDDALWVGDPEEPRDAKGRLNEQMLVSDKETLHQARFTAILSLEEAASAGQFQRLRRRFSDWLTRADQGYD